MSQQEGGDIMKVLRKLAIVMMMGVVLCGCEQSLNQDEVDSLSERLLQDYQVYFEQPLDIKSFEIGGEAQSGLIDRETEAPIYGGDRVGFILKRAPKENEVYRVVGEYKDGVLKGIRLGINTQDSGYSEQSLEQLCVEFLSEHQLAESVSLLGVAVDDEDSVMTYKFEDQNGNIIKVYVNEDIREVVGFLLYDGVDL